MAGSVDDQDAVDLWPGVNLQDPDVACDLIEQLGEGGGCSDLCAAKFLLKDIFEDRPMEQMKTWPDMFDGLNKKFNINKLVPELLFHLGRYDSLAKLGLSKHEVARKLDGRTSPYFSRYRQILHKVSQRLIEYDLEQLKFRMGSDLEPTLKKKITCGHGLFLALERKDFIKQSSLEYLINKLERAKLMSLARKVKGYKTREPAACYQDYVPGTGAPGARVWSMEEDVDKVSRKQQTISIGQRLETLELTPRRVYKMSNRPRGICLIINFQKFTTNKYRRGSQKDYDELHETFTELEFEVEGPQRLGDFENSTENEPGLYFTEHELTELLDEYAGMDHGNYDCFVCCLMSHGNRGHIFTSDDRPYSIEKIMRRFDGLNCPSLAGKPKVFLVQACQGEPGKEAERMLPVTFETDAPSELPAMSDFALSSSTFPGFTSFRRTTEGSLYVMALCKVLRECSETMHMVDMLIEVNNRVAAERARIEGKVFKQSPALEKLSLRYAMWLKKINVFQADA